MFSKNKIVTTKLAEQSTFSKKSVPQLLYPILIYKVIWLVKEQ